MEVHAAHEREAPACPDFLHYRHNLLPPDHCGVDLERSKGFKLYSLVLDLAGP